MALIVDDLDPIYYMVPWTQMSHPPKRHFDRFSCFAQLTREPKAHRHTVGQTSLRATSVTMGRIYALCACDAAQKGYLDQADVTHFPRLFSSTKIC